jgi:hypothetical protein
VARCPQDHGLPIRPADLRRLLVADPRLADADRRPLDEFAGLLDATLHHDYLARSRQLKDLYYPLDPDAECIPLADADLTPSDAKIDDFLKEFEPLLIDANFRRLRTDVIKDAIRQPNEMGLNYVPDFDLFDHLEVWVRGETTVERQRRYARTGFRKKTVTFDAYQRMIVILKFKPGRHLGSFTRADVLYMRLFKNVPHVDMEMHLPEQVTKVRMRAIDKAQIASPFAVSLPTMLWKTLFQPILWKLFNLGFLTFAIPINLAAALVLAPVSAGVNSFFGFQRARQRHFTYMIRQLYYMTQANNASVICKLIESAEEEDFKESLLAYVTLRIGADDPEPWTADRLDATVEGWFQDRLRLAVDFDVRDALKKLRTLGLVETDAAGSLRVRPPSEARDILDRHWDAYYRYTSGPAADGPGPARSRA